MEDGEELIERSYSSWSFGLFDHGSDSGFGILPFLPTKTLADKHEDMLSRQEAEETEDSQYLLEDIAYSGDWDTAAWSTGELGVGDWDGQHDGEGWDENALHLPPGKLQHLDHQ